MKNIKVAYYYANWCGHCQEFMPEWANFKKLAENDKTITIREIEESKMDKNKNNPLVNGFPTILLTSEGKTKVYTGDRKGKILYSVVKKYV